MKFLQLIALASVLLFGTVHATNNDCDHPRFVEHGCEASGTDGEDGQDGQDGERGRRGPQGEQGEQGETGATGAQGEQGEQGIQGIPGERGLQGVAGVVSTKWINEVRTFNNKFSRYSAASEALQIYLPQDQNSRITFGVGRSYSQTGYGIGYAYKTDRKDALAFTLGIGKSGSEEVGKVSVGFEFGGSGPSHRHETTCSYVGGELNMESGADQECK